jgi:hypothetical protein
MKSFCKGSHGLPKDSFKLQTMTALIKSFCRGVQGNSQSAERRAQSENTIYAVRKTPCAMRLPPGRRRQEKE